MKRVAKCPNELESPEGIPPWYLPFLLNSGTRQAALLEFDLTKIHELKLRDPQRASDFLSIPEALELLNSPEGKQRLREALQQIDVMLDQFSITPLQVGNRASVYALYDTEKVHAALIVGRYPENSPYEEVGLLRKDTGNLRFLRSQRDKAVAKLPKLDTTLVYIPRVSSVFTLPKRYPAYVAEFIQPIGEQPAEESSIAAFGGRTIMFYSYPLTPQATRVRATLIRHLVELSPEAIEGISKNQRSSLAEIYAQIFWLTYSPETGRARIPPIDIAAGDIMGYLTPDGEIKNPALITTNGTLIEMTQEDFVNHLLEGKVLAATVTSAGRVTLDFVETPLFAGILSDEEIASILEGTKVLRAYMV